MNNEKEKYIKVAREIVRCYLNEKNEYREIASLLNEETTGKYTYLKEHIIAIRNVMNKSLEEIEKLEGK